MRISVFLTILLGCFVCPSFAAETYWVAGDDSELGDHVMLKVYGAADFDAIEPVLKGFTTSTENVSILYKEFSTRALYDHLLQASDPPDVVLSPAMDLQMKLVNDGYATRHFSAATERLPQWANWRDEIFAFTYEPVAIALNLDPIVFPSRPSNRSDLLRLIRQNPDVFEGKIGLLDVKKVGLGYLTWAHDSQQSRMYGRLLEVFGANHAKVFPNSTSMLQALASSEILVAYNVLGSYATEWANRFPELSVLLPTDYTSVILRSAFVPKNANYPHVGFALIDYLVSPAGQQQLADASSLLPILPPDGDTHLVSQLRRSNKSPFQAIPFALPLVLLTDKARQALLYREWDNAMGK